MLVCRGKSVPLPTNAVRAYRISTIVDQLVRNVDNIVQKEYTSNIVDALQFLNLGIHAVYIYCNGPKYN